MNEAPGSMRSQGCDTTLTIQRLSEDQIGAARSVITEVCMEFFGQPPIDFGDMDEISSHYTPPSGIFLVLMDGKRVLGTGAIRRIDDQICELKRMFFLPPFRGKGYGTTMSERLFEFARTAGYETVRLDTSPVLKAANKLYQWLGFRSIERYSDGACAIFMEKQL